MDNIQQENYNTDSEYNIMITNVSILKNKSKVNGNLYCFDGVSDLINGTITNEAPIIGLQKLLQDKSGNLDKIIMIASESVRTKIMELTDDNGIIQRTTSLEFLRKKIDINIETEDVEIKDEPDEEDTVETVNKVKNIIEKVANNNPQTMINIYIESNGGVRYVMFMLYNIISIMNKNNKNIKLRAIYSMVYGNTPIQIKNTLNIYESSELIAIIGEFINYGRIESLKRYVDKRLKQEENDELKNDIKKCMDKLDEFSQALQLCRSEKILNLLSTYDDSVLSLLSKFNQKYNRDDSTNIIIFKIIFSMILEEFKEFNDSKDENNLDYVIEWCLNKDYVQQALTLCSEQIPKYLNDNGILQFDDKFEEEFQKVYKREGGRYEKNYYKLVNYIPQNIYEDYIKWISKNFEKYPEIKLQISEEEKTETLNQVTLIKEIFSKACQNENIAVKRSLEQNTFKNGEKISELMHIKYSNKNCNICVEDLFNINPLDLRKAEKAIVDKVVDKEDKKLVSNLFLEAENEKKTGMKSQLENITLYNGNKLKKITRIQYGDNIYYWNDIFKMKDFDNKTVQNAIICRMYELIILNNKQEFKYKLYKSIICTRIEPKQFNNYMNDVIVKYRKIICCINNKNYKSSIPYELLEEVIMLYGIAKEQRNTVNHAHVAKGVVLNIYELKKLMCMLVDDLKKARMKVRVSADI